MAIDGIRDELMGSFAARFGDNNVCSGLEVCGRRRTRAPCSRVRMQLFLVVIKVNSTRFRRASLRAGTVRRPRLHIDTISTLLFEVVEASDKQTN